MKEAQFKDLFDQYFDPLRRYLYFRSGDVQLSSDLAQDTFLTVWEKRMDLVAGKDAGLLYKIAGDLLVSHFRRSKRASFQWGELQLDAMASDPQEELQFRELQARYEHSLATMPEIQRCVYLMSRMDGLSNREIAGRLSLSVKAVEKRMTRALAHLKEDLRS